MLLCNFLSMRQVNLEASIALAEKKIIMNVQKTVQSIIPEIIFRIVASYTKIQEYWNTLGGPTKRTIKGTILEKFSPPWFW